MSAAPEVGARKGDLLRLTHDRSVVCVCAGCDFRTDNTGAAASHARSARHRVEVSYSTTFAFVPVEALNEAGS